MSVTLTRSSLGSLPAIPLGKAGSIASPSTRSSSPADTERRNLSRRRRSVLTAAAHSSDRLLAGDCITCPLHGYSFDLRDGRARGSECPLLVTYRASVDAIGELTVEL